MDSTLAVTIPAESYDLTTIATVRAVAGITEEQVSDPNMTILIRQASGICADYCRTVFGQETLTETFRQDYYSRSPSLLILSRRPVASVISVEEDGVAVVAADYEINKSAGTLRRLSSDAPSVWSSGKIVVVYVAGYLLLDDLPFGVERACIELIKNYYSTGSRDASLRRERVEVPGVRTKEQEWWVGAASDPALPREVTDLLDIVPRQMWV